MDDGLISSSECLTFYRPMLAKRTTKSSRINVLADGGGGIGGGGGGGGVARITSNGGMVVDGQNGRHEISEKSHILNEIISSEKKYLVDLSEIVEVHFFDRFCRDLKH